MRSHDSTRRYESVRRSSRYGAARATVMAEDGVRRARARRRSCGRSPGSSGRRATCSPNPPSLHPSVGERRARHRPTRHTRRRARTTPRRARPPSASARRLRGSQAPQEGARAAALAQGDEVGQLVDVSGRQAQSRHETRPGRPAAGRRGEFSSSGCDAPRRGRASMRVERSGAAAGSGTAGRRDPRVEAPLTHRR